MRLVLLLPVLFLCIVSCKKNNDADFKEVTISGMIYDSTAHKGINNVPIVVKWYGPGIEEYTIAVTNTDAQGNYTVHTKIDISRFSNQTLEVHGIIPSGYLSTADQEHTSVGVSINGYGPNMVLPRLSMFEKASLAINLQRTGNDNFTKLLLTYYYGDRYYWVNTETYVPTGNKTYTVAAAAGKMAIVKWTKEYASGATITFQDSVMILPNTANTITVAY